VANEKHVRLLKLGTAEWNFARAQRYDFKPDFAGADLHDLDLQYVNLTQADLKGVNLRKAVLIGAIFGDGEAHNGISGPSWVDLSNADLTEADLTSADLGREHGYKGLCLRGAKLCRAKLRYANLNSSDLAGADLTDADLTGAKLADVSFKNALVVGANFTAAQYMKSGQLWNAKTDARTILPSYLDL